VELVEIKIGNYIYKMVLVKGVGAMKSTKVKNKILENKDRAKSFALGLLCIAIIGAYVVSTVNIFAAEQVQDERPEGMPETDWEKYKESKNQPQETTLDLLLEQERARQESEKKEKQGKKPVAVKTKKTETVASGGEEKIMPSSSVINPQYSALYAGKTTGKKPLLAGSAEKAVEPFVGEISSEQRAHFERHQYDMADARLLELVTQNKVLFDQQDEIEKAQYLLGVKIAAARQARRARADFNELLDTLLLMTDRGDTNAQISEQLRTKIDELAPRLQEQTALLDMFKSMIKENKRVISGEERPLSFYERGADVYAKTKRTLTAPQRLAAEQYGQLKSGASSIQNKLRSWWLSKAEQERSPEERSLSTRLDLEPGVIARLRQDATQEEQKKHKSLVSQLNFAKQMEQYNTGKLAFLEYENKLGAKKAQEKIAILKRALTGEPANLLGRVQEIYTALAAGVQAKQELEDALSAQAKEIVASRSSF
jgi:hypothetical protein